MEKFTKKVAPGKKNHKNTKTSCQIVLLSSKEPLKDLESHLLSWVARRGAPGRRPRAAALAHGLFTAFAARNAAYQKWSVWQPEVNVPYLLIQCQH